MSIQKIFLVFIMMFSLGMMMVCCSAFNDHFGLKDDNILESLVEDVIESKTGISIDLTPQTPDDDDYTFDIWKSGL